MLVGGFGLAELCLQDEAVGRGVLLASVDALRDFDEQLPLRAWPEPLPAQNDFVRSEHTLILDEDYALSIETLDGLVRNHQSCIGFVDGDIGCNEETWPPLGVGMIEHDPRHRGPRLLAHHAIDVGDLAERRQLDPFCSYDRTLTRCDSG